MNKRKIIVDNSQRNYELHIPHNYSKDKNNYPVLFLLHGNPSNGLQMDLYARMSSYTDINNYFLVYPNAENNRWQYFDCKRIKKEVNYIENIISELNNKYNIDTNRLYFSGMSGGGVFCFIIAKMIPNRVAAMAIVSGNMVYPDKLCINSKSAVPTLLIHGTNDFLYNGREKYLLSAEKTIDYWVKENNITNKPKLTKLKNNNKNDGSNVIKIDYMSEKNVIFYKILKGGHHWPNSRFNSNYFVNIDLGNLNRDINTNQIILDFFSNVSKK